MWMPHLFTLALKGRGISQWVTCYDEQLSLRFAGVWISVTWHRNNSTSAPNTTQKLFNSLVPLCDQIWWRFFHKYYFVDVFKWTLTGLWSNFKKSAEDDNRILLCLLKRKKREKTIHKLRVPVNVSELKT
jgi:hypothetical protein